MAALCARLRQQCTGTVRPARGPMLTGVSQSRCDLLNTPLCVLRSLVAAFAVNRPGYAYSIDAAGTPSVTLCAVNTYSPGLKKQRGCVPCPTGKSADNSHAQHVPAGLRIATTAGCFRITAISQPSPTNSQWHVCSEPGQLQART